MTAFSGSEAVIDEEKIAKNAPKRGSICDENKLKRRTSSDSQTPKHLARNGSQKGKKTEKVIKKDRHTIHQAYYRLVDVYAQT